MATATVPLPVSVVVPVRNEAGTLPELFAALVRQSAIPAEVVFVDTGSTDGSAAEIQEWVVEAARAGICCRLVLLAKGYPGAARNAGVHASTQAWIAFIDAGITPSDNWLTALWKCQETQNNDALFGVCRFVADSTLGKTLCALSYGYDRVRPVLPASLFRRELFDRVGYFEPRLRSGEDILWKRALAEAGVPTTICWFARVEYRHFPATLPLAVKKWFVYERSATLAGLGGGLRSAALLCVLLLLGWLIVAPESGAIGFAIYAFFRGVIDPLRRSGWRSWWGSKPWAALVAILVAPVLDLSATAGRAAGLIGGDRVGQFNDNW